MSSGLSLEIACPSPLSLGLPRDKKKIVRGSYPQAYGKWVGSSTQLQAWRLTSPLKPAIGTMLKIREKWIIRHNFEGYEVSRYKYYGVWECVHVCKNIDYGKDSYSEYKSNYNKHLLTNVFQ